LKSFLNLNKENGFNFDPNMAQLVAQIWTTQQSISDRLHICRYKLSKNIQFFFLHFSFLDMCGTSILQEMLNIMISGSLKITIF